MILKKIGRDFNRAALNYDNYAILQRNVAENLFNIFFKNNGLVLDIGCGTGYFHELLRKNKIYSPLLQIDIAHNMCKVAAQYASAPPYGNSFTCTADMHNLPLCNNSVAAVFSSMTMQWAEEKTIIFKEAARVLQNNGNFAFSLVAAGSLDELAQIFKITGHKPPLHVFSSATEIKNNLLKAGLVINEIRNEKITLFYKDFPALLKSIKNIGASYKNSNNKGLRGKNYFANLQQAYCHEFMTKRGLPLSWNIIYVTGNKCDQ